MFYATHIIEKLCFIPWLIVECVLSGIFSFLYLTTSIDLIVKNTNRAMWVAAIIGFIAVIVYAFEAILKFRRWKKGKAAQGVRIIEHAQPLTIFT